MSIFEFSDYKKFVNDWVKLRPKNGHGELRRLAERLRTSSTIISQVFRGPRDLTMEQALDACGFFEFDELEKEYFIQLVQVSRAGSEALRQHFFKQLEKIKKRSMDLKFRLPHKEIMTAEDRAIFYSHWLYSAVRNLSATPNFGGLDKLSEHLNVNRRTLKNVIEFLISRGLCEGSESELKIGPARTHIEKDSLLVSRHHSNWRQKAIERFDHLNHDEELCFTFPMSLSKASTKRIRQEIVEFVSKINSMVISSDSEQCACLNIDWFRF